MDMMRVTELKVILDFQEGLALRYAVASNIILKNKKSLDNLKTKQMYCCGDLREAFSVGLQDQKMLKTLWKGECVCQQL